MSRYIDADNLQRHGNRGGIVYWRDIEAQPTADVRENVKGKWLQRDGIRCSNCNYKLQTTGLPMYCPNCHADMRGVDNE